MADGRLYDLVAIGLPTVDDQLVRSGARSNCQCAETMLPRGGVAGGESAL
ncbi:hypothetical protein RRSWK_02432 [Rhodopirellula sp. SWK7]|nr:hypothetical protein RRSWK_02432 [Rhodopirellula sp. SWK7]